MNINVLKFTTLYFCLFSLIGFSQNQNKSLEVDKNQRLFEKTDLLPVKLKYSRKALRKETNDSTFMDSELVYKAENDDWNSLKMKIRARGNFRRKNCYFIPLKLKLEKAETKGTMFKGQKKLKMVLPCLNESSKDDNVLKEYIIYKMFEVVSPYYFKTRMLDIEYSDIRNNKTKVYNFKGFLIEDDSRVAKRLDAKVSKRKFFPEAYDGLAGVRNALFQYMIGNTDFAVKYQHNTKVIFVDKKFVPVPYDFDMAGFVNTSYSVVSQTRSMKLPIEKVTERYYMGYKRDYTVFKQIRQEFLEHKEAIYAVIDNHKSYFESTNSYEAARQYIASFFKILSNEADFKNYTYDGALELKQAP